MPSVGWPAKGTSSVVRKMRTRTPRSCSISRVARKDKGGLVQIGFAGKRLHLFRREAACIGKDSQGIAFKRILSEDIELGEVVGAVCRVGCCG